MENTILIEVTNQKALNLLHELEKLNLIKMLSTNKNENKTKISKKYRGLLSKEQGKELDEHILKIRKEWDSI